MPQNLTTNMDAEGKKIPPFRVEGSLTFLRNFSCFALPIAPELPVRYIRQLPLAVLRTFLRQHCLSKARNLRS